jgi:hypothetical protein
MRDKPTLPTYVPNGWLLGTPVQRITPKSADLLKIEEKQRARSSILDASRDCDKAGYKPQSLEGIGND